MKRKPLLVFLIAVLSVAMTLPALAHGGRGHNRGHWSGHSSGHWGGHWRGHWGGSWGIFLGVPLGWPGWHSPCCFAPPSSSTWVVVESQPRTFIERGNVAEDPGEPFYWYYCDKPKGYHPYVEECPGGWKKVVPTPPSDRGVRP